VVIANGDQSMADVDKLREEAKHYQELKREYILKANNARSSQPQASSHYMLKAKEYDQNAKEKLLEADLSLFGINSSEPSIDLHTLTVRRSLCMLRLKIDYLREKHPNLKQLRVITGYGRGRKKASVVKSEVMNYLTSQRIANFVDTNNMGIVVVELSTVKSSLSSADDYAYD